MSSDGVVDGVARTGRSWFDGRNGRRSRSREPAAAGDELPVEPGSDAGIAERLEAMHVGGDVAAAAGADAEAVVVEEDPCPPAVELCSATQPWRLGGMPDVANIGSTSGGTRSVDCDIDR
jgi:hypothetical protein